VIDAESSEAGARKNTDAEGDAFRVIEKPLFRHKSRSVTLAETPPPPKPEPVRRPAKVAQQLALAHHLQAAIDRGAIADRADVARKLGLTRARVTQLLDLLLLAPDLQDLVLCMGQHTDTAAHPTRTTSSSSPNSGTRRCSFASAPCRGPGSRQVIDATGSSTAATTPARTGARFGWKVAAASRSSSTG